MVDIDELLGADEDDDVAENEGVDEDAPAPAQRIPQIILDVLNSKYADELSAVAQELIGSRTNHLVMVVHTDIGDIRCPVVWTSAETNQLGDGLLLVKVRTSTQTFVPKPGAVMVISFVGSALVPIAEAKSSPRISVMCLAPPMRLYTGVGVDLLCLLPQTTTMEKQGVLKPGAPSVVSGKPSEFVDEDGDPVADGEKSANIRITPATAQEDFDKPRDT